MGENAQTSAGAYAYATLSAAAILPPALALNGQYWGVVAYLLAFLALALLGKLRFNHLRASRWLISSAILYLGVVIVLELELGLRSILEYLFIAYSILLVVFLLVEIYKAYQRGEFGLQ
jgi:phosphatidylserine synthase